MKNVGGAERIARALFGSSFVLLDFFANIQLELVFLVVGLWGVITSALGYCPFNGIMGRNTCAIKYDDSPTEDVVAESV
ncbi:MAG: hypothetical protein CMB25_01515 [Euryarchaeota archaeon]|nr:hypothetical protein [Euryarchaeota archaeon]|tara:strand:- start:1300 stop:1536 length:237 start_codon:yes stop_codon:yes gene_type:complete